MTSSGDVSGCASSPPPTLPYEYRYRPVLWKAANDVVIEIVAQRTDPDVTVWMRVNSRDQVRYAYVLTDDGLAMFVLSEHDQSTRWSVADEPQFYWPKTNLPDAVSPSNLINWGPNSPAGFMSCDVVLSAKLRELILPALVWWPPELPYRDRAIDALPPPASKPRAVSYYRASWRLS